MKDLTIVVPLGVSSPGTPVLEFLNWSLNSLTKQETNFSYDIIVACDENVSEETKNILAEHKVVVKWYEPYYYMRRGGIWKKIHEQWELSNSKYIAFCHYDDVWEKNKIQSQLTLMENNSLDLSWSKVQAINNSNSIVSSDLCRYDTLDKNSIRGGSYAFTHSSILKKDSFLACGISEKVEYATTIDEHLQFIYSHKLKGMKDPNTIFYHRIHENSVSNQFNVEKEYMTEQRKIVNYSLNQAQIDGDSLNIDSLIRDIESSL